MYVCMCGCVCICVYMYMHICVSMCGCACVYIYVIYIYIYIYPLQSRYNDNVRFFIKKLLKTHFFVVQTFCNHFGSFFCTSNFTILFSTILQHSP